MFNYHNSKVTLELGELVESGIKVWDFEYPSYYEGDKKKAFEQLVIDHYRFRQIGMETPGRWLHCFRTRIREIMPYYIQLYESVELMANVDDPFKAYDLTETFTRQTTGRGSSSDSTSSEDTASSENTSTVESSESANKSGSMENTRKFSSTPQGSVSDIDYYMTEATVENGTTSEETSNSGNTSTTGSSSSSASGSSTSSGTSESEGSETYELKRFGNIGVQPLGQEIEAYRKALINVDLMVINELNDLFLKVY